MQEDENEEYFNKINGQLNAQQDDDSSQSFTLQKNKPFDNKIANLQESVNIQFEQQCGQLNIHKQQSQDSNNNSNSHSINFGNERLQNAENTLRQKKFIQISYIQPDPSFRHQIKLINRNIQPSMRTRELFNTRSKSPKNISSQQNSYDFSQSQNKLDEKSSLQNSIQIDVKSQLQPSFIIIPSVDKSKNQLQDDQLQQQDEKNTNENSLIQQLKEDQIAKQQQSISSIDEQYEEVPLKSTQFKNKKALKYQQYKANLNSFQLESKPITPSDSNNSNPYGFVPNSQIAKIFGIPSPQSTTTNKIGGGYIQGNGNTISNLNTPSNINTPNNLIPINNFNTLSLNISSNGNSFNHFQIAGSALSNRNNSRNGNSQKNGSILKSGNISLNGTIPNSENIHSFEYTRKIYLIIVLNPKQFMAELKSLKMFYEPLELVSMKVKKQGGGYKTLTRKLDINILSQIQNKVNEPSFQVKSIHIPVKDLVVNIKKDGAWAQIKINMDNFYENLDSVCEYLNGKEKTPLDEVQFDSILSQKNGQDKKKQFQFPPFMNKNNIETNPKFTHFYDHLLQKVLNLNEIPYSELDMSLNVIIAATQSLEYINLSEYMLDKDNEELQYKQNNFEQLKQKILSQKPRQKSSNEPRQKNVNELRQKSANEVRRAYDIQSSLNESSIGNFNNKSNTLIESSIISENQIQSYDRQQYAHLQLSSQQQNIYDNSQKTPIFKKERSFIPYQQRNQNEQLWSDSKRQITTMNNLLDDQGQNNNNSSFIQNQDSQIEVYLFNQNDIGIENEFKVLNNYISPPIKYYRQTQNKVFQFSPLEENTSLHNRNLSSKSNNNRNQSCRNSNSQKGKLSPLSLYKNHQQFDKLLIQKIQKQSKKMQQIITENQNPLNNIAVFSKSIASTKATTDKFSNQNSMSFKNESRVDEKIIYPFKLKHIKIKKQNNSYSNNINNANLKLIQENNKNIQKQLNVYERMKLYSNLEQQPHNVENSFEIFQQSPISQTVQISPFQQSPSQQFNSQSIFNSQSVDLQNQQDEAKYLLNYYKQTYDMSQMDSTFEKSEFNQKKEYRRTLVNQINDTKFADSFNKQFLVKFGFSSSRQISEILSKDSFFNHTKEELDIIFGQFLILSNYCLKFMEKPLQEFLQENNQSENMSMKQKTNNIFQKCLYTKFSVLKDTFSVFRRLKELQILKPVLKYILLNNDIVDQYYDQGKEGDIQIYWKDFLRFKVFLVEQKWTRFDKISFILSVINQNNQQNLSIKQINSILPDNMKVSDPKQIKQMKEFLFNPSFLIEGNKVSFTRVNDCLQKEFFLNINEIINHFLTK